MLYIKNICKSTQKTTYIICDCDLKFKHYRYFHYSVTDDVYIKLTFTHLSNVNQVTHTHTHLFNIHIQKFYNYLTQSLFLYYITLISTTIKILKNTEI